MSDPTETVLPPLTMPRQSLVAERLARVLAFCVREGIPETDVRLQVLHGDNSAGDAWDVHSGDVQYDTDARGYWGASSVSTSSPAAVWDTARELCEQAAEHAAQNGRTLDESGTHYAYRAPKGSARGRWWIIASSDGGASFDVIARDFDTIAEANERRNATLPPLVRAPSQLRAERDERKRRKERRRVEAMREARNAWHKLATEDEREELAHDILRAGYFGHVGRLADAVAERVREVKADGGDVDEAATEALHETCDGSAMVIYTAENFDVLRYSGNHDAYTEEMGDVPTNGDGSLNWAALAFSAIAQDVRERFEREHGEALRSSDDAEGDE